jgi:predicted dehydrogenase
MEIEKEDAAAMVMRFQSGALGTFVLSDQTASPWAWEFATGETPAFPRSGQNAVRFMGTKASLDFPNLMLWHHGDDTPDWNHVMKGEEIPLDLGNAYARQIAHFCAVISGREEPRITAGDATETLRVTLAVFDAARSGTRVML